MRNIALVAMVVTALAAPIQAQETDPAAIVTQQFDAFRADDMEEAFSFASPMIQGYFRTPENFGRMVEQGYPMVRNPGKVRMLDLRDEKGKTLQRVEILDSKGTVYLLDYHMVETPNGWKINGVTFVEAPPVAA